MINPICELEKEYIHGDKFLEAVDFSITEAYPKPSKDILDRDGSVLFCHTHFLPTLFNFLRNSKNRYVLVSHNSDIGIGTDLFRSKPDCIVSWFAQNVVYGGDFVVPLPIGMERPGIAQSGNINVLRQQWSRPRVFKNWAYLNLNYNTNSGVRLPIIHLLCNKSFITYRCLTDRISFPEFINEMYQHPFVVSPPGNGLDCIRTWEALYIGVIPILLKSYMEKEFSDLPILFVEKYDMLTEDFLVENYRRMSAIRWDLDKMKMSYWLSRIREEKRKINLWKK